MEDNKDSKLLFQSLFDHIIQLLGKLFNENPDVFVSLDIWEPFYTIITKHKVKVSSSLKILAIDKRHRIFTGNPRIISLQEVITKLTIVSYSGL